MMFRKKTYMLLAALVFFVLAGVESQAAQPPIQNEAQLLNLINNARRAPLLKAEALGLDPQAVLDALPELRGVLLNGLPPLQYNSALSNTAAAHTADMLDNQYYAKDSPDGKTFSERIAESDYFPFDSGETLGMLAFLNYIEPDYAIEVIFNNMFLDELDPERTSPRNILNPDLEEVGTGVGEGQWQINTTVYNAYLITCDFGSEMVASREKMLRVMINQARRYPLAYAKSIGLSPGVIIQDLPELSDMLKKGLPPLRFSKTLYFTAAEHGNEMLQFDYQSFISVDDRTVAERIQEAGYDAALTGETFRTLSTKNMISSLVALRLNFERLFKRELRTGYTNRVILDPSFNDVGMCLLTSDPAPDDPDAEFLFDKYYIDMLVADFGTPVVAPKLPRVEGWVFEDGDENGLYGVGEGLSGLTVDVYDLEGDVIDIITDQAGAFSIELTPGRYRFEVSRNGEKLIKWLDLDVLNMAVPFMYNSSPDIAK